MHPTELISGDRRHADIDRLLARAASIALRGEAAPDLEDTRDAIEDAWRALASSALPHMAHEERQIFPDAILAGADVDAVLSLLDDHKLLRELAKRIEESGFRGDRGVTSLDALDLVRLWTRLFAAHVRRETEVVGACSKPARAGREQRLSERPG
jgi:hypothetical protein